MSKIALCLMALSVAAFTAGCEADLCRSAADHVQACGYPRPVEQCAADEAERLLSLSCADLDLQTGKGDGSEGERVLCAERTCASSLDVLVEVDFGFATLSFDKLHLWAEQCGAAPDEVASRGLECHCRCEYSIFRPPWASAVAPQADGQ